MTTVRGNSGFTLVELMITILIIGVLAGIAVPMFTDNISRAQVQRVHSELSGYTRPIDERLATGDQAALAADPVEVLGFIDSGLSTIVFGTFADASTSTIVATMDGESSSSIRGTTVTLRRAPDGSWTCTVVGTGGRWREAFVPERCE